MRTIAFGLVVAIGVLAAHPATAAAQDPSAAPQLVQTHELVLRDGTRLYGTVERQDETEVVFRTHGGASVTVRKSEVVSLRLVKGVFIDGAFMPPDPNATRLFFAPTGRSLPKGKAYIGVYEFMMPMVQFGVTDRLSIGGGTPLVFGIDDWNRPFWITPKFQVFDNGRTQFAAGVFQVLDSDADGGGIAYGVGTHGTDAGSVTIGAGVAYAGNDSAAGVVMIGGERRLRRNLKFVTENYLWKGGYGLGSFGVRFIGERLSADLGLVIPIGSDDLIAFPLVNFVYVF
jgi:hypothetical protein